MDRRTVRGAHNGQTHRGNSNNDSQEEEEEVVMVEDSLAASITNGDETEQAKERPKSHSSKGLMVSRDRAEAGGTAYSGNTWSGSGGMGLARLAVVPIPG